MSSAVIIRFRRWMRWMRHKCLSWRSDITRDLPLRCLSFVPLVCRRRINSLEMVILDTLKWSATAWWVIPAWTIPTSRSRSFNCQNGKLFTFVDSTINDLIFWIPNSIISNSMMGRKIDFPEFFRYGTWCYCLFCEDQRVSRKHWRIW